MRQVNMTDEEDGCYICGDEAEHKRIVIDPGSKHGVTEVPVCGNHPGLKNHDASGDPRDEDHGKDTA